MTVTINAVSGTGLTQTSDGSGIVKLQSNGVTTNALAWVNFNGTLTGTITPRANYNVGSVTKNGTGDYTCNFTNALSDANYSALATPCRNITGDSNMQAGIYGVTGYSTSSVRIQTRVASTSGLEDAYAVNVAIFGN